MAPESIRHVPRWGAEEFGFRRPRSTWRAGDQPVPPIRWDAVSFDDEGAPLPGDGHYATFHGRGRYGSCQSVALLGATLTQYRIDHRQPIKVSDEVPHRAIRGQAEDELDFRWLFATSRQTVIKNGRTVTTVTPALAIVGAPKLAHSQRLLEGADNPWRPGPLCKAAMGQGLPVYRGRTRSFDLRFATVALQQGPFFVAANIRGLRRSEDGLFRCAEDPGEMARHHWIMIIGWETNDSDGDGTPDEVVWLVRDDRNHRGGARDTWNDPWLDDEWWRVVPSGCLLTHGNGRSIIPGSVTLGSFDDATVPGPNGDLVSYCESDPDGDGIPIVEDICPYTPDPAQGDQDRDGIGDACDPCERPPRSNPEFGHADADRDWIPDACDPCLGDGENSCEAASQ